MSRLALKPGSTPAQQLAWVEQQVLRCRPLSLHYFRKASLGMRLKADQSPVTRADQEVEAYLRTALGRAFPGDTVVGEEFGGKVPEVGAYWTVDPIDGTRAFWRGLPYWGTLLARVERGRPTVGICDFPALGITVAGARGVPGYERQTRKRVHLPRGRKRPLDQAVLLHGGSRWWQATPYAEGFQRLVQACFLERAYGDCYAYLWLFRGYADAVVEAGLQPWDIVPLAAIGATLGYGVWDESARLGWDGAITVTAVPAVAKAMLAVLTRGR